MDEVRCNSVFQLMWNRHGRRGLTGLLECQQEVKLGRLHEVRMAGREGEQLYERAI